MAWNRGTSHVKLTSSKLSLSIAILATVMAASAAQANVLVNSGFETGALTPWAQTADFGSQAFNSNWAITSADAHSGSFSATDVGNKKIEQSFAGVAASSITQVSFWLKHPDGNNVPAAFDFTYSDASVGEFVVNTSSHGWTFFDVTADLDTSKTLVGFGVFGCDCGNKNNSTTLVDDFLIQTAGGVPEPATWALMLMGTFGAGAMLRRQRKPAFA